MKKTLLFVTLLASSLVAHAETLRVHLTVGFPATGTYLPAGDYSIATVTGSPSMLLIEGEGLRAFISGRIVRSSFVDKTTIELDKDLEKGKSVGTRAGVLKMHSQVK